VINVDGKRKMELRGGKVKVGGNEEGIDGEDGGFKRQQGLLLGLGIVGVVGLTERLG